MWKLIAKLVAKPSMTARLIERAKRTPYSHLTKDGGVYMERYWLFNPYPVSSENQSRLRAMLPSIRLHRIMRPDNERHMHDHPWNARTIILRGWYVEVRREETGPYRIVDAMHLRQAGDTARIDFGQYHRINEISEGGVWTMFITWKYRGTWGFLVNGKKVPWRTYLGIK
jgi:hypothetical protein